MRADAYRLAGRYRLVERLGEGGAGTVWRAIDETLDRQVAVKQVRVPPGLTPPQRAAFADRAIHEARSAGRLRDPAIVMVHDVVLDGDQPWIIMDLVTGRSLDKVVKERGPLPPEEVARIGLSVLSALETAHMNGMLHHDVKPANILIDADGSAMLTDFGIAVPLYGQNGAGPTSGGGSLGYMAPERLNQQAAGSASDLWSLGAALYVAAEGRAPFERSMPAAVAAAVLLHDPPFPERAGPELGGLIMAMLAKDPVTRPPAGLVRERLSALAEPVRRRRRWWLAPVAAVAAVLVGVAGWYGVTALKGTPETGRFAAAPDPCGLVGDALAVELLGGKVLRTAPRWGMCQWKLDGAPAPRTLTVEVWAERPADDLGGPQVAERRYASERAGRVGAKGTVFRTVTGEGQDVKEVGEAAYAQTSFKLSTLKEGISHDVVLFRLSNLIGQVTLERGDVPLKDAGGGKETVLTAARTVSAALGG
ncbi:serine/threonine-protein kinase [Nonomuraea rhodomycinica]|uniref:non-specific serine/threonine protein kinase n=1 Tax=Nonomuraea rhodomycinica TaxID=1712872 RepID=A0A7Y6IKT6_9ACTN|nr:serine/threonine-protein kinase [Nonomuraea rhodomycinica]NUW40017.1 serine/threonine protein kinase [Nonomuraea rhodomycinica]